MTALRLSGHLANSGPSAISRTMMAVADRKRQGRPVLGVHVGEPDFDTPQHIKDAGIAAILGNDTHYTAMDGGPDLKDAIAVKFARDSGLTFTRSEIVASASAKMMIFMALLATVGPGDEIIIPAPYWGSYVDIAEMLGATPVVVATRPEDGFRLRTADLEQAITPRAQPPACWRRGEMLNEDQKNGWVLTSVLGAVITFGNWLSSTGFRGPVIVAPAGSPAVVAMPSGGRSGFPKVGISWWGIWLSFEPITPSS